MGLVGGAQGHPGGHQADEVDDAHVGHHHRRHHRADEHVDNPQAAHVHAQADGGLLAALQGVVVPAVEEEIESVKKLLKEEMESIVKLRVPLIAECNAGANWLEAH